MNPTYVLVFVALASLAAAAPALATQAGSSFSGCESHLAIAPVPREAAEPFVPAGFSIAPFDETGLLATAFLHAFRCENVRSDGGDLGAVAGMVWDVAVVPPAPLAAEGTSFYAIPLGFVVDREAVGALLEAYGFPGARSGTADLMSAELLDARLAFAEAAGQDVDIRLATSVRADGVDSGRVGRFFGIVDGEVVSVVDARFTDSAISVGGALVAIDGAIAPFSPRPVAGIGLHFHGEGAGWTMMPSG